ncbi:hypothetical protein [Micromonospora maritima]|uniref:hypothetical protein n=1 Tax=Micromonospora maritima TaxID=986711 RepID=UPI00157BD94C|nr:hypothetical protein [Micromonospora maritima]
MTTNPSLDCITGRHLFADVFDGEACVGGWCLWCGGGAYDGERITDDGQAVGFTPTYRVRVPDGFHRLLSDCL